MKDTRINKALYSYIGGKRKLAPSILSHAEGKVFIDAFAGACSVSLLAKQQGLKVIANDISERSHIAQLALIENSTERITEEDITRLFIPEENQGFIRSTYCPKYFTSEIADFLDNALAVIEKVESVHKKALLKHMLIVYILRMRSFSRFGLTQDTQAIEEGREEEILEISSRSRAKKMREAMRHPFIALIEISLDINYAIVNTGQSCIANKMDVFDFLGGVSGDTVYFDPPYAGSSTYEETYKVLDSILAGRELKLPMSVFNRQDAEQFFDKLYTSSQHIPVWLTSMGKNPNATQTSFDGEELLALIKKHRPNSELVEYKHRWAINTMAGKDQGENIEYLIISKP